MARRASSLHFLGFGMLALAGLTVEAKGAPVIEVYAHRGVRAHLPEHTQAAYEALMKIGVDWADMDVVLTKDGEILVSHDLVLNPDLVRDAAGKYVPANRYVVKNMNARELRAFDIGRLNPESAYAKYFPQQVPVDGARMLTLREVVRYLKETSPIRIGFQIEMKTDPLQPEISPDPKEFAHRLYEVLRSEGIVEQTEIQAFDFRCLAEMKALDARLKTAFLTSRVDLPDPRLLRKHGGSIPKVVKALGGFAWEPEDAQLTRESLAEAKALGLKVVVWTWPEKSGSAYSTELVERMIEWGVDGVITDDPGRLISTLAAKGMRVPPRRVCDPGILFPKR